MAEEPDLHAELMQPNHVPALRSTPGVRDAQTGADIARRPPGRTVWPVVDPQEATMLTRRSIAIATAALALAAGAPAVASADEPVVNWISPVTGQDMRTENPWATQPVASPAPTAVSDTSSSGGLSPAAPLAAVVAAVGLAGLGAGVHRRRAARVAVR
jgi:hypothetical protein